jgi:hypothetical protein
MMDLRDYALEELVEWVRTERLIDFCQIRDEEVVIRQGDMRFVLTRSRAHAFLRGVIQGMSIRWRAARTKQPAGVGLTHSGELPDLELVDSFRNYLLAKWWLRYEEAGCPFGKTKVALMIWVRHDAGTTMN